MKLPTKKEQKHISKRMRQFLKKRNDYVSFNGFSKPTKRSRRCA